MADAEDLRAWLLDAVAPTRRVIYKRLAANDTGATGAHQVGLYLPKRFAFLLAPELDTDDRNPRRSITLRLASHDQASQPDLIYYNNHRTGGTRDECRITGFGDRASALQDPDSTGAVLVLSFDAAGYSVEGWLATTLEEEEVLEGALGQFVPGFVGYLGPDETGAPSLLEAGGVLGGCRPDPATLPPAWRTSFPSGQELADESARRIATGRLDVDTVFMRRRDCEYSLFRAVEAIHVLPAIGRGFVTVDEFLGVAQTVLQRRKSRAGRSLELQLARVLRDSRVEFDAQVTTERGHRPDFIFPSIAHYRTARPGARDLAMLAAKSTLRDRWRQVLEEADKVPVKHLFTLDQGVSEPQFREMSTRGIVLVVPRPNVARFPRSIQPNLITLSGFIESRLGRVAP